MKRCFAKLMWNSEAEGKSFLVLRRDREEWDQIDNYLGCLQMAEWIRKMGYTMNIIHTVKMNETLAFPMPRLEI